MAYGRVHTFEHLLLRENGVMEVSGVLMQLLFDDNHQAEAYSNSGKTESCAHWRKSPEGIFCKYKDG